MFHSHLNIVCVPQSFKGCVVYIHLKIVCVTHLFKASMCSILCSVCSTVWTLGSLDAEVGNIVLCEMEMILSRFSCKQDYACNLKRHSCSVCLLLYYLCILFVDHISSSRLVLHQFNMFWV